MKRTLPDVAGENFDIVVIGSGFGSLFFVHPLLGTGKRILILEWGADMPHDAQIAAKRNTAIAASSTYYSANPKPWNFTIGLGGGTNCWFAQTPRFHPNDFRLNSLYGVGHDWPISYDDLEAHYCEAEEIMAVSGDPDMARVLPRSRPFPQPPHRMSEPDRMLKAARPEAHFTIPTARARIATETRSACCASLRCQLCPADAKFTANNGFGHVFDDPNVTICTDARVIALEKTGSLVRSAVISHGGREYRVNGDLFVLGANAIHSPAILEASGLGGGMTGKGLHESYGIDMEVFLDGVDNFDGSTITTGLDYGLYDGPWRSEAAAALVYFENRWTHGLRTERGRWRQTLPLTIVVEELLVDGSSVSAARGDAIPTVHYAGESEYVKAGLARVERSLPELLSALPVESIHHRGVRPTESHLQGTLRMGSDPETSVVDAGQIHHQWRNLVVVGSSVFATCSCANPSLTVAALSLRAARKIMA